MDENKIVSIIVPVYNAEMYIENTIRMVQAQTYPFWELILVNDCSKDESLKRIAHILDMGGKCDEIYVIDKQDNEGAACARNSGLLKARGRYIAFLDADDIWMPDKLERELAFMKEKEAAFVFSAYEFGDANGVGTGKVVQVPETIDYKEALSSTVIFTSTVLFDTKTIKKDLIHMKDIKSEDTATWWSILRKGYIAHGLNEVTTIYRRPAKSLSSNKIEAVRRIWNLYRAEEQLPMFTALYHFVLWAYRATARRI